MRTGSSVRYAAVDTAVLAEGSEQILAIESKGCQQEVIVLQGLRTAIYPVGDLAAGKAWYSKVIGHAPYFDQPFYVGFNVGGFELGLVPDGTPGTAGPQALWGVADAAESVARLIELGAEVLEAVQEVGDGIRVAAVRDPFGNRLGLIENPHFKLG